MYRVRSFFTFAISKVRSFARTFVRRMDMVIIVLFYLVALSLLGIGFGSLIYSLFIPAESGLTMLVVGALLYLLATLSWRLRRFDALSHELKETLAQTSQAYTRNASAFNFLRSVMLSSATAPFQNKEPNHENRSEVYNPSTDDVLRQPSPGMSDDSF